MLLREAHFADFVQPVASGAALSGPYTVHVGVSKVEFADGTAVEIADGP